MDWSTQTVMAATVLHMSTFRLSDGTYCRQTRVLSPSALVYNYIPSACHVCEIMFQALINYHTEKPENMHIISLVQRALYEGSPLDGLVSE